MGFFDSIQQQLHQRHLNKLLSTQSNQHRSVGYQEAQSIGILFDATDLNDRKVVLEYAEKLKKNQKRVRLLAYIDHRADPEGFSFRNFNKKEIDWLLRPKSKDALDFADTPFDILINLSRKSQISLDYLALISKARFRVGPLLEGSHAYDLMIDLGTDPKLKELTQQIDLFLNKMKPSHGKKAV